MLWQLTFYSAPDAPRVNCFEVGYFDSLDEIEAIKKEYMTRVPGFRDHPDGTWELTGHALDVPADSILWQVIGYNRSETGDERDLLISPLFADKTAAETCRAELSARYAREELCIVPIQVNRRWWTEGFDQE